MPTRAGLPTLPPTAQCLAGTSAHQSDPPPPAVRQAGAHRVDVQEQRMLFLAGVEAEHCLCQDGVRVVEVRMGEEQGRI